MTWIAKSIALTDRPAVGLDGKALPQAQVDYLRKLQKGVVCVARNDQTNEELTYTEPVQSDVTPDGLARLMRNFLNQLNVVDLVEATPFDADAVLALVHPIQPTPDPATVDALKKEQDVATLIRTRIFHVKAVELGGLAADDPAVAASKQALAAAITTDAALVARLL